MNKLSARTLTAIQSGANRLANFYQRQEDERPVLTTLITYTLGGAAIGAAYLGLEDYIAPVIDAGTNFVADAGEKLVLEPLLDVTIDILRESGVVPEMPELPVISHPELTGFDPRTVPVSEN